MLLQRHSQGGGPMKTYFGINVDDDHTCLDRLPEVFVAGPEPMQHNAVSRPISAVAGTAAR
jgi:hypothetical protein